VTVKLPPVMVLSAMSSVKDATTSELMGTPCVGPGFVVAGMVVVTLGAVTSGEPAVVNVHTRGFWSARPVAMLVAPVIDAVYSVPGASETPLRVSVAIVFVLSNAAVPVGLTQGAAHDNVNFASFVNGFIGSLKVANKDLVAVDTSVAWSGGVVAVAVGRATAMLLPRIGSFPAPPHAAARAHINHNMHAVRFT
jgi:hypothetical protein